MYFNYNKVIHLLSMLGKRSRIMLYTVLLLGGLMFGSGVLAYDLTNTWTNISGGISNINSWNQNSTIYEKIGGEWTQISTYLYATYPIKSICFDESNLRQYNAENCTGSSGSNNLENGSYKIVSDSNGDYFIYTVNNENLSITTGETNEYNVTPSRFDTFTYSTTTQLAHVTGYWNASPVAGISEQLVFFQNSSILGKENVSSVVATTTGNFDKYFFFSGLPYTASSTNSAFGLYALIKQIDRTNIDLTNCDTFSGYDYTTGTYTNCAGGTETVLVATSTTIARFDYNLANIPINRLTEGYSFAECSLGFQLTGSLPFFEFKGFDLGICAGDIVTAIFQPLPQDYARYARVINDDVFTRAPFSYIVRVQTLLASSTASTLPSIDYTFSTSTNSALSGILGGERIHFEPFEMATGTGITSIKSDGANGLPQENIWEIAEPYYTFVLYLALVILIISDLMGIDIHDSTGTGVFGSGSNGRRVTNDSYRYKEKLYSMSQRK